MSLILVRIDDRLIHGQVVVGWGTQLNPDRIILCSDTIARSAWEKEIYLGAEVTAPYQLKVSVFTIDETILFLDNKEYQNERVILLVETPQEILDLAKNGLRFEKVNVGGMHYKQGKRRIAPYIFVDDADIALFKEITKISIVLEGQEVPTGKKIDITKAIESLE